MRLPCQLSHLTSSRGARNDASKIENNKTQQTIKFKQPSLQDARYAIQMRAWSSRNCRTSQTCKPRKHELTFLVFPSVKFFESLYAS